MSAKKKSLQPAEKYDREVVRTHEETRCFLLLNTAPNRPGPKGKPVDFWDYHYGVLVALGKAETIFTDVLDDAMQDPQDSALEAFLRAREDVRRAKEEGVTIQAKHVASLLAAKLVLEDSLGKLPTRPEVKRLAAKTVVRKYGESVLRPETDYNAWNLYFRLAELDYLPGK